MNRESWDFEKPIPSNVDSKKDHVKQSLVSIGNIKKLKKDIIILNCELCGRKHKSECWKKMRACFQCGSLEHIARNCLRNVDNILAAT